MKLSTLLTVNTVPSEVVSPTFHKLELAEVRPFLRSFAEQSPRRRGFSVSLGSGRQRLNALSVLQQLAPDHEDPEPTHFFPTSLSSFLSGVKKGIIFGDSP